MMQRDLRWIICDDAARAQRRRIGVQAPEVVEPERRIEAARIVLDQRQLYPAHRPIEPAGERRERRGVRLPGPGCLGGGVRLGGRER